MRPLYEIASQYQQALSVLEDADLPAEVVADTLEGLGGELELKATNVAAFHQNMLAESEAIKKVIDAMSVRRQAIESRIESLRTYLKENMERCGITEIKSPEFVLKIKHNPPSVVLDNEADIPEAYKQRIETVKISKDAIKASIKAGVEVPGAHLQQSTRLDIR